MPYKDPEKQREYKRNWKRNKYRTDSNFRRKQLERSGKWHSNKKKTDPEYNKKCSEASIRYNNRYIEKVKDLITEFRKNGCTTCDENNENCLCAHHKNPKTKKFSIGAIGSVKPTREILKKELKKCTCLCFNCHAKLHARLRRLKKEKVSAKKL